MKYSDGLATIALVVAISSLGVSALTVFRDRPRLKITSQFVEESDYGPARIWVVVVNRGRRPVILRLLGGTADGDISGGTCLGEDKAGLRLGEHERYEHNIEAEHTYGLDPDGPDYAYRRMWIEDSLGIRHPIPKSREYLTRLRAATTDNASKPSSQT